MLCSLLPEVSRVFRPLEAVFFSSDFSWPFEDGFWEEGFLPEGFLVDSDFVDVSLSDCSVSGFSGSLESATWSLTACGLLAYVDKDTGEVRRFDLGKL